MKSSSKDIVFNIVMLIVFVLGVAIVAYPVISDHRNSKIQSKAISDYKEVVDNASESQLERMKVAAQLYNQALYESQKGDKPLPEGTSDYEDILNINGDGIMGYIVIPMIDVELPIYHGTDENVLQVATGHSETSSLPVGGENTHAMILGHRGLPFVRLFNDLDQLEKGDYFELHILNDVLCYEIYDIVIVEPKELSSLRIMGGEDIVTLMTCTPYGINTHRLLVKGKRIEKSEVDLLVSSEARRINRTYVAIAVCLALWAAVMIFMICVSLKRRSRRISRDELLRRRRILDKYQKRL